MKTVSMAFWLVLILGSGVSAQSDDRATEIIRRADELLRGKTQQGTYKMMVIRPEWQRTMRFKFWSEGTEKSFILILEPAKERGITFLKIKNEMWNYIPRINRIIKIPPSMMLQSWMGSDFTNDDLVKESSLSKDYITSLLAENKDGYRLELVPKDEAAVVWGKIIMEVSRQYLLPTRVHYFDEDGVLVRELFYSDVRAFGKRFYPVSWTMVPKETEKADHKTVITISRAVFDAKVNKAYFTKRALKRFSK